MREAAVARQLATFDGLSVTRIVALATAEADSLEDRIREETLVTLLRRLARSNESDAAWQIALTLARRVKRRIVRTLHLWRLDEPRSVAEDVIEEVIGVLYESVFDQSPKAAFWEIRFWVPFDRCLLNAVRSKRADLDRALETTELSDKGEARAGASDGIDAAQRLRAQRGMPQSVGGLLDPVSGALVADALARLPGAERTAFILKHVAGLPEDSRRENAPLTIAAVLGVSGRSVRNYLSRAERRMESWRGGELEDPCQVARVEEKSNVRK